MAAACPNKSVTTANIFIFGDSVDRLIVDDYCNSVKGSKQQWGVGNFTYKPGAPAALICERQGARLGFLNIYGTPLQGPYAHGHSQGTSSDDPYTDTGLRMKHGLDVYNSLGYGVPDLVFFRAELWDLLTFSTCPSAGHKKSTLHDQVTLLKGCGKNLYEDFLRTDVKTSQTDRNAILVKFINDTSTSMQALKDWLPNATLATHTVPTISWGHELFFELENGLRYAAGFKDATLFDFQLLFASQPLTLVLQDISHPHHVINAAFGAIIVNAWKTWNCIA